MNENRTPLKQQETEMFSLFSLRHQNPKIAISNYHIGKNFVLFEMKLRDIIGKPQPGILWSRDSLGFERLYVEIILELSGLHSEL